MMREYLILLGLLVFIGLLQGCTPIAVGGAAAGGATVVHDRRTAGTVLEDQDIEFKALKLLFDHPELRDHGSMSATSYNMIVLLTGQAETVEIRDRYASLISNTPRVRRVINEITIGPSSSLTQQSKDSYITAKAKVALFNTGIADFDPTRVKVVTEQGGVYLMGLVTREEADAVVEKIRQISGVTKVVKAFEYTTR